MSAKHLLFSAEIDAAARFVIRLLPGQAIIRDLDRPLEDLKITSDTGKIARLPVGTVFVSSEFVWPEDGHLHINKFTPLFFEDSVMPFAGGMSPELQDQLDFLVDYLIDHEEYGLEKAKEYGRQFESYGFVCDWAVKETPVFAPEESIPEGANIRRIIAGSYACPKVEDIGFYIDPDLWFLCVRNTLRKVSTLLVGPTGCGKTELMSYVARVMGLELNIVDMGGVQDPQSALLGVHRLDETGKSIFDPAPFVQYVQKTGLLLIDELNRGPLSANNILLPVLDDRRYVPLDIASSAEERIIKLHEGCQVFGTANLGSEYAGTQQLDAALRNRMMVIEMDYLQEEQEVKILTKRTGLDEKTATGIVKISTEIRKQYLKQELSSSVSVRDTLLTAGLVVDGFPVDRAMSSVFLPSFEDAIGGVSERSKVRAIISAF
jgi:nitric oxide reductase NorQ protein